MDDTRLRVISSPKRQAHEETVMAGHKEKGSRSVFYTAEADAETPAGGVHEDTVECVEELQAFVELLDKAGGAGTLLAARFDGLLRDTPYAEIAGQFYSDMKDAEEQNKSRHSQLVSEIEKDLQYICDNPHGKGDASTGSASEWTSEIVGKSFLRFVQVQYLFFQANAAKLTQFANCQMPEDLKCQNDSPKSPTPVLSTDDGLPAARTGKEKAHKPHNVDSPSRLRKQLSSFLSRFGSSSSSSSSKSHAPTQSSFYVDLNKESGAPPAEDVAPEKDEGSTPLHVDTSAGQTAETDDSNGNTPGIAPEAAQPSNAPPPPAFVAYTAPAPAARHPEGARVEVATQEELDIVIDMLSRSHVRPMEAIPENPLSQHYHQQGQVNKAVGSQLGPHPPKVFTSPLGTVVGANKHEEPHHSHGQRLHPRPANDSARELDNFPREAKTNTWPFRPHQRGLSQNDSITQMMQMYGAYGYMTGGGEPEQNSAYGGGGRPGRLNADAAPYMPPTNNNPWSVSDMSGSQRDWPPYIQGTLDNYDQSSKHWSTVADSSSCSDESSSNGEMSWMMGLNMPVVMNGKRRHSSGEEVMSVSTVSNTTLNKSVESLTDPKTKTWPPKHPWANRLEDPIMFESTPPSPKLSHRPLSAQWSDPLNPKGLSLWEPGLNNGSSASYSGLPPPPPAPPHYDSYQTRSLMEMDKKF